MRQITLVLLIRHLSCLDRMNLITEPDYNSVSTADRKKIRRGILHPLSSSTYRVVRLFSKVHRHSCKVHFIFQTKPYDFFCINRSPCYHFVPLRRFESDKLVEKISFNFSPEQLRYVFLCVHRKFENADIESLQYAKIYKTSIVQYLLRYLVDKTLFYLSTVFSKLCS